MNTTSLSMLTYLLAFLSGAEVVFFGDISQNLETALKQTLIQKWRPLTLLTVCSSRQPDATTTFLLKTLPAVVAHSCPSLSSWNGLLDRGIARSEHTVLIYKGQNALQYGFAWFERYQHLFQHTTHLVLEDKEKISPKCNFPRTFYLPTVTFVGGVVNVCISYNSPQHNLPWSELRSKHIIVECGHGVSVCRRTPYVVILRVLQAINESLSLRPTVRMTHSDVNPYPAAEPDISLNYGILFFHAPVLFNLSPFMLRTDVIFYAHRKLAYKQFESSPPFVRFLFRAITPVALSVLFFALPVRGLAKLTRKLLHEPDASIWALLLSATLCKGYEVRSSELSSHTRRLVISFWFLANTCIVAFLQSVLTSSVAVPDKGRIEYTLEHFYNAVRGRTVCACGDAGGYMFLVSDPKMTDIQESFHRKTGHCRMFYTGEACHRRIIIGSHVGVIQELPGETFCHLKNVNQLVRGKQTLGQALIGAFVRKGFPLWRPFHTVIRRAIETGWFEQEQASDVRVCSRPHYEENSLPWYAGFLVLLGGYALSVLTFICELVRHLPTKYV